MTERLDNEPTTPVGGPEVAATTAAQMRPTGRRTILRRFVVIGAAGAALVVVAGVAANLWVAWSGGRGNVASAAGAPTAQVAIILGAKAWRDRPSPMLADRLDIGIELYKAGKVPKLLLSGDHGTTSYDEVNTMRAYVLARGVPEADVFTDHAGFSTYDTMYRARDVFLVERALVVTQGFHLARAVYTARALGLTATGVAADQHDYPGVTLQLTLRDWLARVKAVVQLHVLHASPRFLGPSIPITGDGRASLGDTRDARPACGMTWRAPRRGRTTRARRYQPLVSSISPS